MAEKDAFYFSHDSNAHKDPKILKLRAKHGWEGYGIYWAIVETLREQKDYKWLADDKQLLTFSFSGDSEVAKHVLDTCLEVGLLMIDDDDYIHSESLTRRMKMKDEISEKRRQAGRKGGQQAKTSKSQANAKQNPSNKGKEIKESKEKRESKNRHLDYVLLTTNEYDRLVDDFGRSVVDSKIEDLDTYLSNNGTNKYKDHNKTLRTWMKKDGIQKQKTEQESESDREQEYIEGLKRIVNMKLEYWKDIQNNEQQYWDAKKELEELGQL